MKRFLHLILLVGMMAFASPSGTNPVLGSTAKLDESITLNTDSQPAPEKSPGMPGWPVPAQPVPHHEPGQPARSGAATHLVTRLNAFGELETVELQGLDALLANGTISDPLQGNYRLASLDKIMFSANTTTQSFEFIIPTLQLIPGTTTSIGQPYIFDIAAGDLNGDFVDEQITAFGNFNLHQIKVGEMPGTPGNADSAPAVAAHPDGSLDVLVRGSGQALWHLHYDGATWDGWNSLGGVLLSSPTVASRAEGELDVFVVGTDNQIHRQHFDGITWSGWSQVAPSGTFPELTLTTPLPDVPAPAVAARSGDELDLFRLGPDNTLWWCHSADGLNWGTWQNLGGMLASGPGAVALGDGRMQVYALGLDGALWYRTYDNGWGDWQRLETPEGVAGNAFPALASPVPGQVNVYLSGTENRVWSNHNYGSTWSGWISIDVSGGELDAGIGVAYGLSAEYIFAQMSDGSLQYNLNTSTWTGIEGLDVSQVTTTWSGASIISVMDIKTGYFMGAGRQQVAIQREVFGGWPLFSSRLEIWDMGEGFSLRKIAEVSTPIGSYKITAGDVDGDGIDEIGLVNISGPTMVLRVYKLERDANGDLTGNLVMISSDQYDFPSYLVSGQTILIEAGDVVTESDPTQPNDEFVVASDWRYNGAENDLLTYLNIYDHDQSSDEFILNRELIHLHAPGDPNDYSSTGVGLAVGDFDGPQPGYPLEEIAFTIPDGFPTHHYPDINRSLFVYRYDPDDQNDPEGLGLLGQLSVHNDTYSRYTYLDTLAAGDIDLDLKDEILMASHQNETDPNGPYYLQAYEYNGSLLLTDEYPLYFSERPSSFNLAPGDFTGESLRVGSPTYRVQDKMTTPVAFINLPPMHRDIIDIGGVDTVIEVVNDANAVHFSDETTGEVYSSESKHEWELSTGFETSVGSFGHTVSASMDYTHGENFSKSTTEIQQVSITDETTASIYDQVIFNKTDYAVWEYPVYGAEGDNPDEAQTISVVWPLVNNNATNLPSTRRGTWCDENFYAPSHQIYNIWSYDHTTLGEAGFKDLGETIISKETTGGSETTLQMSDNQSVETSSSYHNQISAGLEYSYENELKIPFIGKAWDFSFRAYANGSYSHESLSTFGSEVTNSTGVSVDYPSHPSFPIIKAYLYWAEAEYMVADYQTVPGGEEPWLYYNKPDPAFILPWYGFPDPFEPVAPTCGPDRKLFTHDIELDPAYVQNGETVTMTATLRNFSAQPLSNVTVRFYLGEPAGGNDIGSCSITNLNRILGPKQCSDQWMVTGASGEEKVYAVIDPENLIDEMHDEGDPIDNNVGYGLMNVANADYFDPGLKQVQVYQAILYEEAPGLGFGLYLPTANMTETVRYELVPTAIPGLNGIGSPIQVLAFRGGEQFPEYTHIFGDIPAGMVATYRDSDLNGTDEADLKLYRQVGANWVEATCPGYQAVRFPEDNRLAVPICQTGTFVLATEADLPTLKYLYLPLSLKSP